MPRRRDRRGRGMRGPGVLPLEPGVPVRPDAGRTVRLAGPRHRRPTSTSAGRTGSGCWSTPSRTRPRSRTTGTPRRSRCRRWCAARKGAPTRLVLFRRPIEHRAETRSDLEALVLTVVVEQVAELLGHRRRAGRPPLPPPRRLTRLSRTCAASDVTAAGRAGRRGSGRSGPARAAGRPWCPAAAPPVATTRAATSVRRGVTRTRSVPSGRSTIAAAAVGQLDPLLLQQLAVAVRRHHRPRRPRRPGPAPAAPRPRGTSAVIGASVPVTVGACTRSLVDDRAERRPSPARWTSPAAPARPRGSGLRSVSVSVIVSTDSGDDPDLLLPLGHEGGVLGHDPELDPGLVGTGVGEHQRVGALAARPARAAAARSPAPATGGSQPGGGGTAAQRRDLVERAGRQPAARDDDVDRQLAAPRAAARPGRAPGTRPPGTVTPRSAGYVERAGAAPDGDVGDGRSLVGVAQLERRGVVGAGADAGEPVLGSRHHALGRGERRPRRCRAPISSAAIWPLPRTKVGSGRARVSTASATSEIGDGSMSPGE